MILSLPRLVDIHVHLREPGEHAYKETIAAGLDAAHAGGFGAVLAMPNTKPPVDSAEKVREVLALAPVGHPVELHTAAAVTLEQAGRERTRFSALKAAGAAALSDDGVPVSDPEVFSAALFAAEKLKMPLLVHCEPETECLRQHLAVLERAIDDRLLPSDPFETRPFLHICHVSCAASVALIREAKRKKLPVTAETAPHYLLPQATGKINPPLEGRTQADIDACVYGLVDGTLDCIASDHAPHTLEEKAGANPPNGASGLETAFSAAYTALVASGWMNIEELVKLMRGNPAKILRIPLPPGRFRFDPDADWTVAPQTFRSMGKNSAFAGVTLRGRVVNDS